MNLYLKLLSELPVVEPSSASGDIQLVAIADNTRSVRVPASSLINTTTLTLTSPPSSPTSGGLENAVSVDATGIYTYSTDGWGKSPRLQAYWNDLTENSRFLLCNTTQILTDDQKANALQNLGISQATTDDMGLVRLTADVNSNDERVPTAAAIKRYIDTRLSEFQPQAQQLDLSTYRGPINLRTLGGHLVLSADDALGVRLGASALGTTITGQAGNVRIYNGSVLSATF